MKNHLNSLIVVMKYSINPLFLNVIRIQNYGIYLFNRFQKILNTVETNDQNKAHRYIANCLDLTMNIKA